MINEIEKTNDEVEKKVEEKIRKPYVKPALEALGDLRTITLGGSPFNVGDTSGVFNTAPYP
jgi:hypothetical protein